MIPNIRLGPARRVLTRRITTASSPARSYLEGPTEPPLSHLTISAYFKQTILPQYAERPGLICRAEKPRAHGGPASRYGNMGVERHLAWTFGEMDEHVMALARGLLRMGVKKGDRVGVVMGNNRYAFRSFGYCVLTCNVVHTQCCSGLALALEPFLLR